MKEIPKHRPVELDLKTSDDLTNEAKNYKMKEVKIMGNLDAKETSEMVFAVGKLVTSGKLAKEDDGKITPSDATHFIDDIFPLIKGLEGINKIPKEFADGFDENDKAQINQAWTEGAELYEKDEAGVLKALNVIYALNDLLIHLDIIKPSAPDVG